MEYIIKSGLVKFAPYSGSGRILITPRHVYALSEDNSAGSTGGVMGGLIGALIGNAIDSFKHRNSQPEYLNDPDLEFLDEPLRKSLRKTKLLVKLALGAELIISPTFAGFDFTAEGRPHLAWRGLIHKSKVRRFLEAQGGKIGEKKTP